MIGKARAILNSLLYLLLFVFCVAVAEVVFTLLGLPGFAPLGAAVVGVCALILIVKIKHGNLEESFSLRALTKKNFALIIAIAIPITILIQCTQFFFPSEFRADMPEFSLPYGLLSVISIAVTTPVIEEIFFRGFIFKNLSENFHPVTAIIISSLFFSGLHPDAVWAMMAMLISVFYSILFLKFKSLFAPVAAHMTSNIIAVVANVFLI
ncbi:MAG: CPBP family intramembrane metalloprotease [Defluviitaleaceae bacterium]|nr:CPBP family intramembrane metalloprotease [Defluviitaleaceae bacterium]